MEEEGNRKGDSHYNFTKCCRVKRVQNLHSSKQYNVMLLFQSEYPTNYISVTWKEILLACYLNKGRCVFISALSCWKLGTGGLSHDVQSRVVVLQEYWWGCFKKSIFISPVSEGIGGCYGFTSKPPAARRPPPAARNGVNAITQKPRDGLFSNLVYTLVVIVSWPD